MRNADKVQHAKQFCVVIRVRAAVACVARGKNSGGAVQRVDHEAAIVGDASDAKPLTVGARLEECVRLERIAVLLRRIAWREIAQAQ